jgi:hypothetical protein
MCTQWLELLDWTMASGDPSIGVHCFVLLFMVMGSSVFLLREGYARLGFCDERRNFLSPPRSCGVIAQWWYVPRSHRPPVLVHSIPFHSILSEGLHWFE